MSEAAKIISDIYVGNRQMRFAERQKIENEITTLRQLLERAEARVARLFSAIVEFQRLAWMALDADYIDKHVERSMNKLLPQAARITGEVDPDDIDPSPFVLRAQADAVEEAGKEMLEEWPEFDMAYQWLTVRSESLRSQADELEQTNAPQGQ